MLKYRTTLASLPRWAVNSLRWIRAIPYRGKGRDCQVCASSSSSFRAFGNPPRDNAQCPHCGSLERHRLFWLFAEQKTNLFDNQAKSVLHIAPEACLEARLKGWLGKGYLTADFSDPRAMVKMDITNIQYANDSFDIIYCSHVLEHVQEDVLAMREIRRVLKHDGWAVLLVPITVETTYEDPTITDPIDRLREFGQEDHLRRYGNDYIERLRSAGLSVEMFRASDLVSNDDALRLGLGEAAGEIYHCRKN